MINLKITKIAVPAIALTAVILTLTTLAALNSSQSIDFSGSITTVNVELYSDASCTQPCNTINVGAITPGDTFTQKVYVKNTGTVPETLSLSTNNWSPTTASNYMTLSWNRENYVLNPGLTVEAILTLEVESNTNTLTTFSFSATITGTQ